VYVSEDNYVHEITNDMKFNQIAGPLEGVVAYYLGKAGIPEKSCNFDSLENILIVANSQEILVLPNAGNGDFATEINIRKQCNQAFLLDVNTVVFTDDTGVTIFDFTNERKLARIEVNLAIHCVSSCISPNKNAIIAQFAKEAGLETLNGMHWFSIIRNELGYELLEVGRYPDRFSNSEYMFVGFLPKELSSNPILSVWDLKVGAFLRAVYIDSDGDVDKMDTFVEMKGEFRVENVKAADIKGRTIMLGTAYGDLFKLTFSN